MVNTSQQATPRADVPAAEYDVIIIGAGVTGLYQLYRIRELGLSVRVYDDADGVGGTWNWNRYPGCRFDSESETYGYSWSEELLQEWDWKEHFSAQPDTERYMNYVADKFDLRRDIQLSARVKSAIYNQQSNRWHVELTSGERVRAQFVIGAVGIMSADYTPDFAGIGSFKGLTLHTGRWPKQDVHLAGKRVAVIGTGPTGVQLITEVAKVASHLTVFQRTPNYCAPLRNAPVSPETQREFKATYAQIHQRCRETPAGFRHDFDPRSTMDVPKAERHARYEELWQQPGFAKWLSNFHDITSNREANHDFAEFVRNKIRDRINDKVLAEKLVPKDHPFGSKRIPMESGYYEVFNQSNVRLVDVRETPIERFTAQGIKTTDAEHDFDVVIFATGFDAITGSVTRIDVRGVGGESIKDRWAQGPRAYLGLQTAGFPNFFLATNSAFCNYPVCAELIVEWIANAIGYLRKNGLSRIAPTPEAEEAWVQHAAELASQTLLSDAQSWFMGSNIPGKARALLLYSNSAAAYREKCLEVAAKGYEGFALG